MPKHKKGHAMRMQKRNAAKKAREMKEKEDKHQANVERRAQRDEKLRENERYLKRTIKKLMHRAASQPECLIGWWLRTTETDGSERDGLCIDVQKGTGRSTKMVIRYKDTGEELVQLRRKQSHVSDLTKVDYTLLHKQEPLPELRGIVTKRAIVSRRNWKRRFFVLNGWDSKIAYWRRESEYRQRWEPRGRFDLTTRVTCKVYFDECEEAPDGKSFAFECTSTQTGATLVMSAKTEHEMREWVNAIRATIEGKTVQELLNPRSGKAAEQAERTEAEVGMDDSDKELRDVVEQVTKSLKEVDDLKSVPDVARDLLDQAETLSERLMTLIDTKGDNMADADAAPGEAESATPVATITYLMKLYRQIDDAYDAACEALGMSDRLVDQTELAQTTAAAEAEAQADAMKKAEEHAAQVAKDASKQDAGVRFADDLDDEFSDDDFGDEDWSDDDWGSSDDDDVVGPDGTPLGKDGQPLTAAALAAKAERRVSKLAQRRQSLLIEGKVDEAAKAEAQQRRASRRASLLLQGKLPARRGSKTQRRNSKTRRGSKSGADTDDGADGGGADGSSRTSSAARWLDSTAALRRFPGAKLIGKRIRVLYDPNTAEWSEGEVREFIDAAARSSGDQYDVWKVQYDGDDDDAMEEEELANPEVRWELQL